MSESDSSTLWFPENFYIFNMLKYVFMLVLIMAVLSCKNKEAKDEKMVLEKSMDSYGALIEKAKGTEAILQKKADSIARQQAELGIPY